METLSVVSRKRSEFINITDLVKQSLEHSGVQQGIGVIFCPHTTAGLTINESWDPDVINDTLLWLSREIPKDQSGFQHSEGNSDSHIKTGLFGNSAHVIVEQGKLVLGQWQGIFFCEFDGPRNRSIHLQWLGKQH